MGRRDRRFLEINQRAILYGTVASGVRVCVCVSVFLPSADRMCVLTIVEFRFIEAWIVVFCVQCAVCVWSSLMRRNTDIVPSEQNKNNHHYILFRISCWLVQAILSKQKKLQICLCDSDCVSTVGVASNRKIQLIVRMDDSRRKIMAHWHCT